MNRQMNILAAILVIFMLGFSACKPKESVNPLSGSCFLSMINDGVTNQQNLYNDAGLLSQVSTSRVSNNSKIEDNMYEYNANKQITIKTKLTYGNSTTFISKHIIEYTYLNNNLVKETISFYDKNSVLKGGNVTNYEYDGNKLLKKSDYSGLPPTTSTTANSSTHYTTNSAGKVLTEEQFYLDSNSVLTSEGAIMRYFYRSNNTLERKLYEYSNGVKITEELFDDKENLINFRVFNWVSGALKMKQEVIYAYTYSNLGIVSKFVTNNNYSNALGEIFDVPVYVQKRTVNYEYTCVK